MSKNTELTMRTKENLLTAFWQTAHQKKLDKITVKEIAILAGYNRSTFYEYFTDIDDLLNYAENTLIEHYKHILPLHQLECMTPNFLQHFTTFYEERGDDIAILLGDNYSSAFQHKLKNMLREEFYAMWQLPKNDVRSTYIFEFMTSAAIGTITYWHKNHHSLPTESFIELMYALLSSHSRSFHELLSASHTKNVHETK